MFEQSWKKPWRLRTPALPISLADRHWLNYLPGKIFSACMKFGGSRRRDAERHGGQTDRHTDTQAQAQTQTHTQTHTETYLNEIIY